MQLQPGIRLGPYEILAALGSGGMGEVYRARDTKLGRDVALKILPEAFASDPDRLARFRREAQVLASLNHPNIAIIHELAESPAVCALVLELVDGPTLADRIANGAIPLDEAIPIARQIAEALEAAHGQGVIHRDLKPANIKLRPDGVVKVLDFGLAKLAEVPRASDLSRSQSPTITTPAMMTGAGVILGTAAYMSPEQARGRTVDKRADIWAFGSVLYEMVTGRRAFPGDDATEAIAAIVKSEPDWQALPPGTPRGLRTLLTRCLRKDPSARLRDIGDAKIELDEAASGSPLETTPAAPRTRRAAWLTWASAGVAIAAVVTAVVALRTARSRAPGREWRLEIATPPSPTLTSVAISPDGDKLAYVATTDGGSRLWIRRLTSGAAQPLAAAGSDARPFWSPDSRSIGFFADGKLKRIDIDGGAIQILANASVGGGGSWSAADVIVFSPGLARPLSRIAATGGQATDATQTTSNTPRFLPDGRHYLYWADGKIHIGDLNSSETRPLLDATAGAEYLPSGHLLFVRSGTLFVQPFDAGRLTLGGKPAIVAQQVISASLSVAADGTIVYRQAPNDLGQTQLTWFDRTGHELRTVGAAMTGGLGLDVSPDGRRVATAARVDGNLDVYLVDLADGQATRLTFDPANETAPVWSSDGSRIVFQSDRGGERNLYIKPVSGAGREQLMLKATGFAIATDWSREGRFLLLHGIVDERRQSELLAMPVDGKNGKPFPISEGPRDEGNGQFSPDGRWIVYQSDESGHYDVYVQPFSGRGGAPAKRQVSLPGGVHQGGAQARWRADGKELFYVSLDGWLMAVPIELGADAQTVEMKAPVPLFATRIGAAAQARTRYAVSADVQQFLMNAIASQTTPPITVIVNWRPKT